MSEDKRTPIEHRVLSRQALKALGDLGGLHCGPLSPLARIARPTGPADRDGLIVALQQMVDDWAPSIPALLDPGLTLGLIVADREDQRLGQYLWADPEGLGAGFKLTVANDALLLDGPTTLEQVQDSLLELLAPAGVAEIPPERMALDADQFWAVLALIDAHGTAAALRQAVRASGPPPGVTIADIRASWEAGLAQPNPGWALSMVALLAPESVPADFAGRLPAVLAALQAQGLLTLLEGAPGDALGDLVLLGSGLELLCRGLSAGGIGFGFVRAERSAATAVEVTSVAGWRTPGGFVLADISALAENRVEVLLIGPAYLVQLIGDLLGTRDSSATVAPPGASALSAVALLERLHRPAAARKVRSAPPQDPAQQCPKCAASARAGARFCARCGSPLAV
jgi:hypothetical protein